MASASRIFEKLVDFFDRGIVSGEYLPNWPILVGTHHKTGTVWLRDIFLKISRKTNIPFIVNSNKNLLSKPHIYFNEESSFDFEIMTNQAYKGVHMIRDPRDIAISGMFYHQKSKEAWLHENLPAFNGITYQQKINSYNNLDDRLYFEMENAALRNTQLIKSWNYSNENFLEIKYEQLINDSDLKLFHNIFTFLGFKGQGIQLCLKIAYSKSLFSKKKKKTSHIRSGQTRQWEKYFKPVHKKRFYELHGDLLVELGYEKDNLWVEK